MTPTQRTLALDPAKLTGYAHTNGDSGVINLGSHPHYELLAFVESFIGNVDLIAAEDAQLGSHNFTVQGIHAEYRGILRLAGQTIGVPVVMVNPASLKAWACGNGRATKQQMMKAAKTLHRKHFTDHNECDAWWVLKYVEARQHERMPKAVKRREAVRRKKEPKLFK